MAGRQQFPKLQPRHARRQLDQQRVEAAVGLSQQQAPGQSQQQPGPALREFRHTKRLPKLIGLMASTATGSLFQENESAGAPVRRFPMIG